MYMEPLKGLKIDCISDTHTKHDKIKLPGGDILIHSGDCSFRGTLKEVIPFLDWFAEQDYSYLIFVPGNHDWIFEEDPWLMQEECKSRNIILLNDSSCEVEGIKIWGSPVQPWFHDWAFNRIRGEEISKHWQMIPEDTEILITHGPPYLILDDTNTAGRGHGFSNPVGCEDLYKRIMQTTIKLHVFGHIHEGAGHKYLDGRTFVNASSLDGYYMYSQPGYTRVVKQENEYFVEENESLE